MSSRLASKIERSSYRTEGDLARATLSGKPSIPEWLLCVDMRMPRSDTVAKMLLEQLRRS